MNSIESRPNLCYNQLKFLVSIRKYRAESLSFRPIGPAREADRGICEGGLKACLAF
jgi:hypothetical protein